MLTLNQKEGWKKSENGYASTKEGFSLKKDGHLWKSQHKSLRDQTLKDNNRRYRLQSKGIQSLVKAKHFRPFYGYKL